MSDEKEDSFQGENLIKAAGAAGIRICTRPPKLFDHSARQHSNECAGANGCADAALWKDERRMFPILSLGGVLKETDQLVFRQALKSGVPLGIQPTPMDGETMKRRSGTTLPSSRATGKKCSW